MKKNKTFSLSDEILFLLQLLKMLPLISHKVAMKVNQNASFFYEGQCLILIYSFVMIVESLSTRAIISNIQCGEKTQFFVWVLVYQFVLGNLKSVYFNLKGIWFFLYIEFQCCCWTKGAFVSKWERVVLSHLFFKYGCNSFCANTLMSFHV